MCVCAGLQYYVAKASYREGWRSSQSFTLHILLMNTSNNYYQYVFICLFVADSPPPIFFFTPQGLVLCSAHFRWWYGSDWLNEWMSIFHFFDSLFFSQETGIIEFRLLDSWGTPPNLMLVSEGPTDLVVQGLVQTETPTCPRRPFSNLQSCSSSQWIAPRLQKPE